MIEEGSAAWDTMSPADRAKRKRAAAEARTKLRSPNFFLSRTRLCLRNLPPALSEKALKDLVIAAVRCDPPPHFLHLPGIGTLRPAGSASHAPEGMSATAWKDSWHHCVLPDYKTWCNLP